LNNLSVALTSQGEYARAQELGTKCLEKRKIVLGPEHRDTIVSMNNLAYLYSVQPQTDMNNPNTIMYFTTAQELYTQCLKLRKIQLGEYNPETLTSINNLALLYANKGELNEAEKLYEECLQKRKKVLGDDHPDTLDTMNNLANLYLTKGQYDIVLPLYTTCLEKRQATLGDDHPDTLTSLYNIGLLQYHQGKITKSKNTYLQVLVVGRNKLGESHPIIKAAVEGFDLTSSLEEQEKKKRDGGCCSLS
jgi:tetratricopeptide (TPR) repeat protein